VANAGRGQAHGAPELTVAAARGQHHNGRITMADQRIGGGRLRKQRTAADTTPARGNPGWGMPRNNALRERARRALPAHCAACRSTDRLELDHITNLAAGGTDGLDNVQWLCRDCHAVKTKTESLAGLRRHHDQRRQQSLRPPEPRPGLLP
jgi:5-methylcytosine-specific restriction enzyme A